jgi:hypothetical protein
MTYDDVGLGCIKTIPKARLDSYVTVEIGDVSQRIKVRDLYEFSSPAILQMALCLTDARHRTPIAMMVGKVGKTKVRVFGLGKKVQNYVGV